MATLINICCAGVPIDEQLRQLGEGRGAGLGARARARGAPEARARRAEPRHTLRLRVRRRGRHGQQRRRLGLNFAVTCITLPTNITTHYKFSIKHLHDCKTLNFLQVFTTLSFY